MTEKEYRKVEIPTLEQLENVRRRYQNKKTYGKSVFITTALIVLVVTAAVLVSLYLMPVLQIFGNSMEPTLKAGQIVAAFRQTDYERGDIVVFRNDSKLLVKRVIAAAGDTVDIKDNGDVYVNGILIDEPYAKDKVRGKCDESFPIKLGSGEYFVLGDNRSVSIDSRSSAVGCVPQEQIAGKIFIRIWPMKNFGLFK